MQSPRSMALVLAMSALVFLPVSASYAEDQGELRTSTLSWSTANSLTGSFTGGSPRQFDPDQTGWTAGPFSEIGRFGVARTVGGGSVRDEFESWNQTVTIEQGQSHSLVLDGVIIVNTLKRVTAEPTMTASGSSLHADIHLEDFWADSLAGLRMYWQVDFAAGDSITYSSPTPGTLIATDSSGEYATVVLHASSSASSPGWGGRDWYEDALVDGDSQATLWIPDIPGSPLDVDIDAFVIDYDPCGAAKAASLAQTIAADPTSYRGTDIAVQSGCVTTTTGQYTTGSDDPQTIDLVLDQGVADPDGSTRVYSVTGAPDFLDLSVDSSTTPASVQLSRTAEETLGEYSLSLTSWLEPASPGDPRTAPLSGTLSLSVVAPEPEPEPEPEPTPAATTPNRPDDDDDDDEDDEEVELIEVSAVPGPPAVALPDSTPGPAEDDTVSDEVPEPDFQLQESEPPTPIPSEPDSLVLPDQMTPPEQSFFASAWWLWLIVGSGLLWWAFIWIAPRLPWSARHR